MRIPTAVLFLGVAAASQAGMVLGLDNNGIYKINTGTGAATVAASLAGHGTGDTNALAYNPLNDTAYFMRNGNLWSANLSTNAITQTAFNIGTDIADATFYNGSYYYASANQLKKVNLTNSTMSVVANFNKNWSFGDIATTPNGLMYGSAGASMFTINLANNAYTQLPASGSHSLQLAFDGNSLFGIGTGNSGTATGAIYSINTTTGQQSNTNLVANLRGSALAIRDAATYQAVPEPTSIAALGLGAVGILRRRRAKKA